MGTTKTAFQNDDGIEICFVVAIEGFSSLITNFATPANLFTASTGWHGSGWTTAIGGLDLEGAVFEQKIVPWDCQIRGNGISVSVMDCDGVDLFGKEVFKGGAGNETELNATATNSATTITVKDTTNFSSSGTIYIGTERITHSGKSGTSFTGCTRGIYSPFKTDSGANFGRNHQINRKFGTVPVGVKVTDAPRTWVGKWVGIWMHRVTGGVLDTKANAELLHAGKIDNVQDSSNGNTVISIGSVLDAIGQATVFNDQWSGRVKEGFYVEEGFQLEYTSSLLNNTTSPDTITNYSQIFSAATSDLTEGEWYKTEDFLSIFSDWFHDHSVAGTLPAGINAGFTSEWGGFKFVINLEEYPGSNTHHKHKLTGLIQYLEFLGFRLEGTEWGHEYTAIGILGYTHYETAPDNLIPHRNPSRVYPYQGCLEGAIEVEYASGEWVDQTSELPDFQSFNGAVSGSNWGVLKLGENLVLAKQVTNTTFSDVRAIPEISKILGLPFGHPNQDLGDVTIGESMTLEIKQVLILEGALVSLMSKMLATTGISAFNDAAADLGTSWGPQMGAAIPWELCGDTLTDSISGIELGGNAIICVIDSPTSFQKLFLADLTLRGAYWIFRNGVVQLTTPQTPVADHSKHVLTEDNKAAPSGTSDSNRTPTEITAEFLRNVFTVEYAREMVGGKYQEKKTFLYQSSVDDYGQSKAIKVKARNSYILPLAYDATEDLIKKVVSNLLPVWGRPMRKLRRTVDLSLYLDIAPGDTALITDSFARNPDDGTRGITSKPAMVLAHRFAVTGGSLFGEVDLLIGAIDSTVVYAPTAKIDETIANSGYTAATPSITVKAAEFTLTFDAVDASHFVAGDLIRIEEISPSNPASTTYWDRTVASVAGNVITLTATLSSPAWDTAKEYNVFSQIYSAAQATQKADCYQADSGDLRILNTRSPYTYGNFQETQTLAAPAATALPEKHSNSWFGDGVPLTTVCHQNLGRMVNNLVGYKTAARGAMMTPTGTALTSGTAATWILRTVFPVYLGAGPHGSQGGRLITVSPFFKASQAAEVFVRVTISKTPPSVDPFATPSVTDVVFDQPFAQAEFKTSATTYAAITAQTLPAIYNTSSGIAYVSIELKGSGAYSAVYWGLARFEVGAPGV
jgi:hypothetical protein